jgi:hypothetical protein
VTIYDNDGGAAPHRGHRAAGHHRHSRQRRRAVGLVDLFNGVGASPAAGERLFTFNLAAAIGTAYPSLNTPAYCRRA